MNSFRLIAKRRPKQAGSDPRDDIGWHNRTVYYPDPGLRSDLSDSLGYFDPMNLMLYAPRHLRTRKIADLLTNGRFGEAKKLIPDEIFLLNEIQRQHYLLQATSVIHELRHLHECFGTTSDFGDN